MKRGESISAEHGEFLQLVARSAFGNPFSREREGFEREITNSAHIDRPGADDAPRVVRERLGRLADLGFVRVGDFGEADRSAARATFLYDAFHGVIESFDALIEAHVAGSASRHDMGFVLALIGELEARGFDHEESAHFAAVFYQLRRAYYFIERGLIGSSGAMERLRMRLWSNVFTFDMQQYSRQLWSRMEDFSTLLLGPTGSGKGACAAAIGRSGYSPFDSKTNAFVDSFQSSFTAINLSQYADALIESELFGHKKGAFTGALQSHDGVFAQCSPHGAIFLDEIGDMSASLQIKLLTVLEERIYSPVGSREINRFEGRVIAATHRELDDLRQEGAFREDFFYRLCSDVIRVPTLAERIEQDPDELIQLVTHLVNRMVGTPDALVTGRVLEALSASPGAHYAWPGNVRELEQAIRRILLTGVYDPSRASALASDDEWLSHDAESLLARYCGSLYRRLNSYESVGRHAGLDRRTVKKYVLQWEGQS